MSSSPAELTRGRGVLLALAAGLMIALPVALTLTREDSYESRITIFPNADVQAVDQTTTAELRHYVETLIPVERVARATAFQSDFPLDQETVVDNTRLDAGPADGIDLVVEGGTPSRAISVAALESKLIVDLAGRRRDTLTGRNRALTRAVRQASDPSTPAAERPRLRQRLADLLGELDRRAPLLTVRGGTPSTPEVSGSVDELVDRLPGDFPPNPGAIAAALAGLLLACGLFAAAALVGPLRLEK